MGWTIRLRPIGPFWFKRANLVLLKFCHLWWCLVEGMSLTHYVLVDNTLVWTMACGDLSSPVRATLGTTTGQRNWQWPGPMGSSASHFELPLQYPARRGRCIRSRSTCLEAAELYRTLDCSLDDKTVQAWRAAAELAAEDVQQLEWSQDTSTLRRYLTSTSRFAVCHKPITGDLLRCPCADESSIYHHELRLQDQDRDAASDRQWHSDEGLQGGRHKERLDKSKKRRWVIDLRRRGGNA